MSCNAKKEQKRKSVQSDKKRCTANWIKSWQKSGH